jgi:predicted aldo/keto reductase-like oxidoreductase
MHVLGATERRNACMGTGKCEKACMGHNEVLECMHRAQQSVNIFEGMHAW